MRLGEAMVKEGLITNDLLAKALERQIIFGGRLGTNLVEMGAINEETLARFLSKELRVPYAEPSSFEEVPPEVLEAMPRELAEKYTAFPISKERNRLHVAMKDPNDIAIVDELRFIVGLDIRPYIASEMRIVFALEKYYGIKRDLRYVAVQGEANTFDSHLGVTPSAPPRAHITPAAPVKEDEYLGDASQTDVHIESMFAAPVPRPMVTETAPPHEFTQPAPEPPRPVPPPVQQQAPVRPQAPPPPPPPAEPEQLQASPYQVLASPDDREQIARAILDAALNDVSRAALFMVKGELLSGWCAKGQGLNDKLVSSVMVNLAEPNLFKDIVEEKIFYKGPILQVPQNKAMLDKLGGQLPMEVVAYPLIIKGKVVGVLYGDNGHGSMLAGNIDRLASLMAKASMSLEILILKTKILAGE